MRISINIELKRPIILKNNPTLMKVVALALRRNDGRILLQKRPQNTAMAGLWEFPGGKMENGETPEQSLKREIDEELGIKVAQDDLEPVTFASEALADRHLLLLLYQCSKWQGQPIALHAEELRWVTLEEMSTLPMPPADAPFTKALERANWK